MFQNFSFQSLVQSDVFKMILPVVIVGSVCAVLLYLFFRNPFEEFPKALLFLMFQEREILILRITWTSG